ncbi:MAG: ATP-binding cassette domain-containing protein, partial [Spirochaetales bacterium]|nr:ATP-binding cassette domain-containing protein [Spirochaetales bacterium]
MLEVKDLKVRYGNIEALHGISFTVNKGEIVTLIGSNGAGKTTTLLSLARLPRPEAPTLVSGDIIYNGESLVNTPPHEIVSKKRIALVPEGRHIFGNLTVNENLEIATYALDKGVDAKEAYDQVYSLFPRLYERRKQRSESLSGGVQQMLAVGRALMSGAD